jgi:hypothetical protein
MLATPEVSDNEGGVQGDNNDIAKSVTPRPTTRSQPPTNVKGVTGGWPPASAKSMPGCNDESENDKENDMAALGELNCNPLSVGSLVACQVPSRGRAVHGPQHCSQGLEHN